MLMNVLHVSKSIIRFRESPQVGKTLRWDYGDVFVRIIAKDHAGGK